MILDVARLLLFPRFDGVRRRERSLHHDDFEPGVAGAGMGFLVLAPVSGMAPYDILIHAGAAPPSSSSASAALPWAGSAAATPRCRRRALWLGFAHLLNYLVYASLFGGVLTVLLLQFRQWPLPYPLAGQPWLIKLHAKESGIPYASRSRSAH